MIGKILKWFFGYTSEQAFCKIVGIVHFLDESDIKDATEFMISYAEMRGVSFEKFQAKVK